MLQKLSFEHFDPQTEIGKVDENGNTVRPRKKPGRKPNPPTPAQRKAQNRAAQRAFRERKRQEMREAEMTIRKCIYMRDQAIHQANMLQQQVEQLRFENNYLKGHVLILKLACMANDIDIPKLWDANERDSFGCDSLTYSNTQGIPQSLEFFLDNKRRIINMVDNWTFADELDHIDSSFLQDLLKTEILSSATATPSPMPPAPSLPLPLDPYSSSCTMSTDNSQNALQQENPGNSAEQQAPAANLDMSEYLNDLPAEASPADTTSFLDTLLNNDPMIEHQQPSMPTATPVDKQMQQDNYLSQQSVPPPEQSSSRPLPQQQQQQKPSVNNDRTQPQASGQGSKTRGPMTAMEYLEVIRSIKDVDDESFLLFAPTELQRKIPHDPRIDLIPGAVMRDWLIIFKDFYELEDLFMLLLETALFKGGQIGDPDCWYVPDVFLRKYWFVLPNHKPSNRCDNSYELMVASAKHMMKMLDERKRAYIQRSRIVSADQCQPPHPTAYHTNIPLAQGCPFTNMASSGSSVIAGM